jgi:NADPH2:quinone reductase
MPARRVIVLERFGPPDVMSWSNAPLPDRGPDDVLIAVEAIGVNFADTMVRRGEYRRDQPLDFIPGFEVAGTVVEGPADGPAPGTRVVGFTENGGGYADHVVVPRSHVYVVRPEVSSVQAASIFVQGVTAWYSVHRYGRVTEGDWVLVPAASGGLGVACIQLSGEVGARTIGTASTEAKLAIARERGATAALLSDPETLTDGVRELTAGHGADVVLDGVGGPLFKPALRALALNGRYVVMGAASQAPSELDARVLMPRGQTIAGVLVARVAELDASEPQRAFDEVQQRHLAGVLRPEVTVMAPGDLPRAHELIESRTLTGKVVIDLAA